MDAIIYIEDEIAACHGKDKTASTQANTKNKREPQTRLSDNDIVREQQQWKTSRCRWGDLL